MPQFAHTPVAACISGLQLSVLVPSFRFDLADEHAGPGHLKNCALEGLGPAHHAILLSLAKSDRPATMNAQAQWRRKLASEQNPASVIRVEPEMHLGEMVLRAAEPLLTRLAPAGNLVINCQSTRESVFGSSNAGRILSEAARGGLGFTVGQRGLVSAFQAVEAAMVLGRSGRFAGSALLCAGDRWIDIYPRVLGDWATLSDGAAAAAFTMSDAGERNMWVTNDRVSRHSIGETANPRTLATMRDEIVDRLCAFVDTAWREAPESLRIVSPDVGGALGEQVQARMVSRYRLDGRHSASRRSHFGAANPFINLHLARERTAEPDACPATTGYLTWDCDPSGLFGAIIVQDSAFENAPRRAT